MRKLCDNCQNTHAPHGIAIGGRGGVLAYICDLCNERLQKLTILEKQQKLDKLVDIMEWRGNHDESD